MKTVWEEYPLTQHGALPVVGVAAFGLLGFTFVTAGLPISGLTPLAVWANCAVELVLFGLLAWAFSTNWSLKHYHVLAITVLLLLALADVALQLLLPADFDAMYVATLNGLAFSLLLIPAPRWAKLGIPAATVVYNLVLLFTFKRFSSLVSGVVAFSLVSMYAGGTLTYLSLRRLSLQDVRRREEDARSSRFQRALADSAFDAAVILDEGRMVEFNRAFQELVNLEGSELLGRDIRDVLPVTDDQHSQITRGGIALVNSQGTELEVGLLSLPGFEHSVWILNDVRSKFLRQIPGDGVVQRLKTLPLTKREKDIVVLTVRGLNRAQVALELFISEETVKSHLAHIYQKLRVKNRAEMTSLVWKNHPNG